MKVILYFLLGMLSFTSPVKALENEEKEIVICLETENPLTPLYLLPTLTDTCAFTQNYIQQLEEILKFDLAHNGKTYISKRTLTNDRLPKTGEFKDLGLRKQWESQNIFYVVKFRIQEKSISAILLNIYTGTYNSTEAFVLTGKLDQDRKEIHRLTDLIHKAFFGTNGIASTKILFSKKGLNGQSEIWEMDYDGANQRQLTHDCSDCVTPAYLPPKPGFTSGGFLYVSYKLGQPKIFITSFKNLEKSSRLTLLSGNQLMPAISAQRDQIAFVCDAAGNPDLFLQPFSLEKGAIEKPYQIFSAKPASQGTPTFSPDGKSIAFVSNKEGAPKIYVMPIPKPGTHSSQIHPQLITKKNRENTAPAWSPDGKKLAYCARQGGERQIWIYDFETGQEKQLTQGQGHKENPSWAPNSLHLVFNSTNKNSDLYMMNLNQSEATQLTSGIGENRFPAWEPRLLD